MWRVYSVLPDRNRLNEPGNISWRTVPMSPNVPTRLCWASMKKLPMEFSCLKVLGRVTEWVSGRSQLVTIREKCVPYVWWDWLRAKKRLFGDSWSIPTFSSDCCCCCFESLAIRTLLCSAELSLASLYACAALASENYTMMNGRQITGDSYAAWPDRWRHWD